MRANQALQLACSLEQKIWEKPLLGMAEQGMFTPKSTHNTQDPHGDVGQAKVHPWI